MYVKKSALKMIGEIAVKVVIFHQLPIKTTTIMGFNDKPCIGIRYEIGW